VLINVFLTSYGREVTYRYSEETIAFISKVYLSYDQMYTCSSRLECGLGREHSPHPVLTLRMCISVTPLPHAPCYVRCKACRFIGSFAKHLRLGVYSLVNLFIPSVHLSILDVRID
jgi:hypothetical protein